MPGPMMREPAHANQMLEVGVVTFLIKNKRL